MEASKLIAFKAQGASGQLEPLAPVCHVPRWKFPNRPALNRGGQTINGCHVLSVSAPKPKALWTIVEKATRFPDDDLPPPPNLETTSPRITVRPYFRPGIAMHHGFGLMIRSQEGVPPARIKTGLAIR